MDTVAMDTIAMDTVTMDIVTMDTVGMDTVAMDTFTNEVEHTSLMFVCILAVNVAISIYVDHMTVT